MTDENVREEVDKLLRENNGPNSLLNSCEDAARGHIPARARRGRSVVGEEMDAQADVVQGERYSSRCQGTADSLTKASGVLQGKLLEDKIFHLVVEWCDSPQERTSGIAYADCAVVYDKDGQNCSFVQGQASDNLYLHVPHRLLRDMGDPALQVAQERLERFYAETFWLNNEAAWAAAGICV